MGIVSIECDVGETKLEQVWGETGGEELHQLIVDVTFIFSELRCER